MQRFLIPIGGLGNGLFHDTWCDFTAVIVLGQRFIFPTVSSHQSEGLREIVSFAVFRSDTDLKTGGLEATGSPSDGNKAWLYNRFSFRLQEDLSK